MNYGIPIVATFVLLSIVTPLSADSSMSAGAVTDRAEVEFIIRNYLMENPEVIRDAMYALQVKEAEAQAEAQKLSIRANAEALFADETDPVGGNPAGDITIVEFFDYACGYCQQVAPDLAAVKEADENVRVVYKDFPILGQSSYIAATWALAARNQEKYVAYHHALMAIEGTLDEASLREAARQVGLDVDQLMGDAAAPEIEEKLASNYALAQALGINGTPAILIGDFLAPGAMTLTDMLGVVSEQRMLQ